MPSSRMKKVLQSQNRPRIRAQRPKIPLPGRITLDFWTILTWGPLGAFRGSPGPNFGRNSGSSVPILLKFEIWGPETSTELPEVEF